MTDLHPDQDRLLELALGHADGAGSEKLTAHLVVCAVCRRVYDDLAGAVELVLPAVPRVAPPPTFEGRVLGLLADVHGAQAAPDIAATPMTTTPMTTAPTTTPGLPRRTVLWAAAAAVLGVAAGAGATAYLGTEGRDDPGAVPWSAPLLTADGATVGRVSHSYGDEGPLLVVEVTDGPVGKTYTCRLRHADGSSEDVADWSLAADRPHSWVVTAGPGSEVTSVELVAGSGAVWASAQL